MPDLGGINPNHAVAGFGGGIASLPFLRPNGRSFVLAALSALSAGVATASYMTPLVAEVLASPKMLGSPLTQRSELGLAFLLGVTAMLFIPAVLGFVGWVGKNIGRIAARITGVEYKEEPPKTKEENP